MIARRLYLATLAAFLPVNVIVVPVLGTRLPQPWRTVAVFITAGVVVVQGLHLGLELRKHRDRVVPPVVRMAATVLADGTLSLEVTDRDREVAYLEHLLESSPDA